MLTKQFKAKLFKILFSLHIYGGLFCAAFLVVAGLSVLNFQHHFMNDDETFKEDSIHYFAFDSTAAPAELAAAIRDSLGVKGFVPNWDYRSDSTGTFSFQIHRPSRRFYVKLNRHDTRVEVSERHFGAGQAIGQMHKAVFGELANPELLIWSFYGKTSAILALISVLISMYFWFKKSIKNRKEWFVVIGMSSFSFIFMLFMWMVG